MADPKRTSDVCPVHAEMHGWLSELNTDVKALTRATNVNVVTRMLAGIIFAIVSGIVGWQYVKAEQLSADMVEVKTKQAGVLAVLSDLKPALKEFRDALEQLRLKDMELDGRTKKTP